MYCHTLCLFSSLLLLCSEARVVVIHRQLVHEENNEVQQLIGAGFTKDESIRAIERWETAEEAMEYLLPEPESKGLSGSTTPVQAKEDSLEYQTKVLVSLLYYLCLHMSCVVCTQIITQEK